MAAAIPDFEPETITAGDTAKWTRSLIDYPASDGWTLAYTFLKEVDGQAVQITAGASGADHLVNVSGADSSAWPAGNYNGQAYVSKAGERYTVWRGPLLILDNFQSGTPVDARSQAKRILDFLDGCFERLARKQAVNATIEGVQFQFRNLDELTRARNYWGLIVYREKLRASGRGRAAIFARFTEPR